MSIVLATKRTDPKLTYDQWLQLALEIFRGVYDGQMARVMKTLARDADPATVAAIMARQYYIEPSLVKATVQKFYDDMALSGGQAALDDYDLTADWDDVQEGLFTMSRARSGWFARAMTETSQRQTQLIVRDWLQTEGSTVRQLREQVTQVWKGPRPNAAATTETTYVFAESRRVAWQASGVWGYGINTRNDDRVRDTHKEAAAQGPYPLSDREHYPPVYGDVNCRCTPYPVRENPNAE